MGKIDLAEAMAALDEKAVLKGVDEQLAARVPAMEIIVRLQRGMEQVGKRYAAGDYFLAELILSADIFANAAALLDGEMVCGCEAGLIGTMVLGTVKDDIHDTGKNIVAAILTCAGIKVVDLGVDVPATAFVKAVKAYNPQVVGLCCLLTTAVAAMKETVTAIKAVSPTTKLLVGGGAVNEDVASYCGADGYCRNACDVLEMAEKLWGRTEAADRIDSGARRFSGELSFAGAAAN